MFRFSIIRQIVLTSLAAITCNEVLLAQTTPITGDLAVSGGLKAGTGSSDSNLDFRTNGILMLKGVNVYPAPPLLASDDDYCAKLFWNPTKASFRAGFSGEDSYSLGYGAAAFGSQTISTGGASIAWGNQTFATGGQSTAGGGDWSSASGDTATAIGSAVYAIGSASVAFGALNTSTGQYTFTVGYGNTASGTSAMAMGEGLLSQARNVTAVGRYNVGGGSGSNWVSTDPLFEIGNGSGEGEAPNTNAITVLKNANTRIGGELEVKKGVRVPPQGDLSMGSFTAGRNPADLDPSIGLDYPQQ